MPLLPITNIAAQFGFYNTMGLSAEFNIDASGQLDTTLPLLTFSGSGFNDELGYLNVDIPVVRFTASGDIDCFGILNIHLPRLGISAQGDSSPQGIFNVALPEIKFTVKGLVGAVGTLNISLPRLTFTASSYMDAVGILDITIPMFKFGGHIAEGAVGILDSSIPIINIVMSGVVSVEGKFNVTIPIFMFNFTADPDVYYTMVMNVKNNALTEYENYIFNSMGRFDGKHLGVSADGIYNLDLGDTDDGNSLDWNFRLGYMDLEQVQKKKLHQAWLSYQSNGDIIVTVVQPDGIAYEYPVEEFTTTETGRRVKFGRGIRTKYAALDIQSKDGSSIVLDVIRIHVDKQRYPR